MKVTVDPARCSGHGRCYSLAPDVFASDDDGYGTVAAADVPRELESQARTGEQNCPERAISLSPSTGEEHA